MAALTHPDLTLNLADLAQMIDHSLLHPTTTDSDVLAGLETSRYYSVASVCIKPYHILFARKILSSTQVKVCAVISFPHGNSTTEVKVFEARRAIEEGAHEIDMVVDIGRVLSGKWEIVENEIRAVNDVVIKNGGELKVIFENDNLGEKEIVKLCEICSEIRVAYINTSTGNGFGNGESGDHNYKGATIEHLKVMRKHVKNGVKIKAAGGAKTLDDLLRMRALGVERIGTTATKSILDDARKRGIGAEKTEVAVPDFPSKFADEGM